MSSTPRLIVRRVGSARSFTAVDSSFDYPARHADGGIFCLLRREIFRATLTMPLASIGESHLDRAGRGGAEATRSKWKRPASVSGFARQRTLSPWSRHLHARLVSVIAVDNTSLFRVGTVCFLG